MVVPGRWLIPQASPSAPKLFPAGSRVPLPGRPLFAEADQPGAIRAERRGLDRTGVTDPGDFPARGHVPQAGLLSVGAGWAGRAGGRHLRTVGQAAEARANAIWAKLAVRRGRASLRHGHYRRSMGPSASPGTTAWMSTARYGCPPAAPRDQPAAPVLDILRLRHRAQPGKQLTLPLQPRPAGQAHQPRAAGSQIRHHQANRYTMNQQAENAQAKALRARLHQCCTTCEWVRWEVDSARRVECGSAF